MKNRYLVQRNFTNTIGTTKFVTDTYYNKLEQATQAVKNRKELYGEKYEYRILDRETKEILN